MKTYTPSTAKATSASTSQRGGRRRTRRPARRYSLGLRRGTQKPRGVSQIAAEKGRRQAARHPRRQRRDRAIRLSLRSAIWHTRSIFLGELISNLPWLDRIKIFADGASLASMLEAAGDPRIAGFTTNPTLMRKAGVTDYLAFAKQVLAQIRDKPISFE